MLKSVKLILSALFALWGFATFFALVVAGYTAMFVVVTARDSLVEPLQIAVGAIVLYVISTWLHKLLLQRASKQKTEKPKHVRKINAYLFFKPAFATGLSFFLFSLVSSDISQWYSTFAVYVKESVLLSLVPTYITFITVFVAAYVVVAIPIIYGLQYVKQHYEKPKQQNLIKLVFLIGLAPWFILLILFFDSINNVVNLLLDDSQNIRIAVIHFAVGVMWIGWAYELFTGSILKFVGVQVQKIVSK